MGIIDGKVFKSGNSAAVRLPKDFGFAVGTPIELEYNGNSVTIRPKFDPAEEKRKVRELVAELEAIWDNVPIEERRSERVPIEFPDRPGLY